MKKPVLLMILDGWGIAPADKTNAAAMAKTPNLDSYFANYPHTTLEASGKAVGPAALFTRALRALTRQLRMAICIRTKSSAG